jgi:alcohol dehydrogenase (cytochrome c)/quinohemoprotein ethanol dehydrogenase
MTGPGGAWPMLGGQLALKAGRNGGPNRLLVFRLDGRAALPPSPPRVIAELGASPAGAGDVAQIRAGDRLYGRFCLRCHGVAAISASFVPDLRRSAALASEQTAREIVLNGALRPGGMPGFGAVMTPDQLSAIRSYVLDRARKDRQASVR